jgi:hydroxypyruvate reductase
MLTAAQLRRDALQIWWAGVDAVLPQRLVPQRLRVEGRFLLIGDDAIPLDAIGRIVVVGGGKAGAGMAEAVETTLGPRLIEEKQLTGWVNVPGGADIPVCRTPADSAAPVQRIHLHAARPAGVNEPTAEGVAGAMEILRLVESLGPDDLCLCLLSGGGSALMPAPVEGITLADKLAITRHLSAAGANIEQLNTVRKQLSRIKGGGLLRACHAGRLVSLIISDVLGDPLDIIASGPTVPDTSTPQAALAVLERFGARDANIASATVEYLERACAVQQPLSRRVHAAREPGVDAGAKPGSDDGAIRDEIGRKFVRNIVLANNATAVAAAAKEAERLGYSVASESATHAEGPAEEIGRELAERALRMRVGTAPQVGAAVQLPPQLVAPTCFISGGEPVVKLVESSRRGLGGRNQQLVLAALLRLIDDGAEGIALLSGGTDGEDGPTDAAGALLDVDVLAAAREKNLDPADFLARNDAYHFFEPLGALVKTGPTQTNVCDVRLVVCGAKPQVASANPRAVD